jgi:hypothetical protein
LDLPCACATRVADRSLWRQIHIYVIGFGHIGNDAGAGVIAVAAQAPEVLDAF